jgi:hypothetical protein
MEFVVKGETREGRIMILKRGFASQDKAEDHPIRMSDWNYCAPLGKRTSELT